MERMILVKKSLAILVALVVALAGLLTAACAESTANPHAAEWLSPDVAASLDTLKRVDEDGVLYEMNCDYDYYTPVFSAILTQFGAFDAG